MKNYSLVTLISLVVAIVVGASTLGAQSTLEMKLLSIEGISLIIITILVLNLYIDKYIEDRVRNEKRKSR